MSEIPEEWRSAVDAASGRTYWYHRKTRISTWIKPDFAIQDAIDKESFPTPQNVEASVGDPIANDTISNARIRRFVNVMKTITSDIISASSTDISSIYECIKCEHSFIDSNAEMVITDLVNLVIQSSTTPSSATGRKVRHTALRALCALSYSAERRFAGQHFYAHQAWTALAAYAPQWQQDQEQQTSSRRSATITPAEDPLSLLLLTALHCHLLVGPTYYLQSGEANASLSEQLEAAFTQSNGAVNLTGQQPFDWYALLVGSASEATGLEDANIATTAANSFSPLLDARTVQTFGLLAEKGHRLPATWLLAVFHLSLR